MPKEHDEKLVFNANRINLDQAIVGTDAMGILCDCIVVCKLCVIRTG